MLNDMFKVIIVFVAGYHHVSNHIDPKKQYIQRFTRDVTMFSTALQKLYTSGGGYDKLADVAGVCT